MCKEVKKYNWFYNDNKYTLEEYIEKVNELISSATTQMEECQGDLYMSEYAKLMSGAYKLNSLNDQLKEDK